MKIDVSQLSPEREEANRVLWVDTFITKPGVATPKLIERITELKQRKLNLEL